MSRSPVPPRSCRRIVAVAIAAAALLLARGAFPARAATPRVHAIVHARIVTAPGQRIDNGTIVIRDGIITAVGANVPVPADARVWDAESLTVYAGLIDAYVPAGTAAGPSPFRPGRSSAPPEPEPARGAVSPQPAVRADYRVIENAGLAKDQLESLRAAGFTAAQVAPRRGVVRGTSAVMGLGDGTPNDNAILPDAAQVVALEPWGQGYPGSLMGAIAVIRQAFLDAKWYRDAQAAWAAKPGAAQRPPVDEALAALQPAIAGREPVQFVAGDMLGVLRAAAIAREAGVSARAVGAGDEYKRVRDVAATGLPLVVPVSFPDAPDVSTPDAALEVGTEELRAWRDAPGNPAALARAGVTFALTANGLKDTKQFAANVAKAIRRDWSADAALASVTTVPARMLGLEARLGTIAPGRIANLTVTRGELFGGGSVREVWIDGNRYETAKDETKPAGKWSLDWGHGAHPFEIATGSDTTVTLVLGADTLKARDVRIDERRARFTFQPDGEQAQFFDLRAANDALAGTRTVPGAGEQRAIARPAGREERFAKPEVLVPAPDAAGDPEAWRVKAPEQPAALLVRNATVWTSGPQGTLQGADLLVTAGKVTAVGRGLAVPKGATVIDGTGLHVAPGIIDEHSHAAILGNVNECTNSVTCEVRIQDVVNSESPNIYRQLAGGVTAMHLLHGSCNTIGGQCAVIRSRWGAAPDQLLMSDAPPTVKFALGENPKQANFGNDRSDRYPKTRAGVEQVIREAFLRAQDYDRSWAEFKAGTRALPPRRDLQLDALSEIVHGTRLVHVHSYRQDEILMLMRLAESFGFRINTFTHILEGYKVADEIAAHGASAVGFSDWWQYKQEVIDAIPWNAYILWDRGVNVGFNSDDGELARRLNTEAAKAIKYGGVPPEEALRMVTLNPAKSLKIDGRMGSLEPGKDADFAIWSGSPLSPYSACLQTWIEGRRYFDRAADLAGRDALAREREALIAAARGARKDSPGGGPARRGPPPRYLEDTDQAGNECGHHHGNYSPFESDAVRRAREAGEGASR
jgi:imidazolonepropionase-like amidohydrolase